MSRYFCLRFDVDTFACASIGMPNLVKLADEHNSALTFFVNMGRAVSRPLYLRSLNGLNNKKNGCAKKLSPMQKFGVANTFYSFLVNPEVGNSCHSQIRFAHERGHEIGLHGGFNHAIWQRQSGSWSRAKISKEIDYGMRALDRVGIDSVTSFASPGWQGSELINEILSVRGFRVVADQHGTLDTAIRPVSKTGQLVSVPTLLSGEPCGVGFIENLRAEGYDDQEILEHIAVVLNSDYSYLVLYDHPGYVGIRELSLVSQIIELVKSYDYNLVTLSNLVDTLDA